MAAWLRSRHQSQGHTDIEMDDKADIVGRLNGLVQDAAPSANLKSMYGGTVIELEADNPKSRIAGFYVYDTHVSFEFANGHTFHDPTGLLEGSGKRRRHVKLHSCADIETKRCRDFLLQAVSV